MQPSGSSRLQYFPANAGTCSFSCSTLTWCQVFSQQTTLQSPVGAQHFGVSLELWNMTCFEHRNYTLSLWETVLKKSWMLRPHQTPSEILFQIFLQSFENKKTLNLYLGFCGVIFFFFFFYKNTDLCICMVYSRAVYTAHFSDAWVSLSSSGESWGQMYN